MDIPCNPTNEPPLLIPKRSRILLSLATLHILGKLTIPQIAWAFPLTGGGTQPSTIADLEYIVAHIIRISVALGGIALFAMLVLGGIQYLSSGGDPKAAQQAKNTITYGIAGIALFVLAWFVLVFIENFTGVKVTIFKGPEL